jgi:hypothetical protein
MWYFNRGVVLTKDNLAIRNCNGSNCAAFFECHYAKALWRPVHIVLGIKPPWNIKHLFNSWSMQVG